MDNAIRCCTPRDLLKHTPRAMAEKGQTLVQEAALKAATYACEQNIEMEAEHGQPFGDYFPHLQEALQ